MSDPRHAGGIVGWLRHAPLRVVITLPIVALIVATATVIAWIALSDIRPSVEHVARDFRAEVLIRVEERLRDYLRPPLTVNDQNLLALRSGILDLADVKSRQRFFYNQVASQPLILYSFFGTPEGEFYGARRLPDGELQIVRAGKETGGDSHNFGTNPLGDALDLKQIYKKYDPRTRPWYMAGEAAHGPAWSPVYRHFTIKDMALTAALPAYDDSGRLLGVFGVDYVLKGIHEFLAGLHISNNGEVFILERDGNLVASSSSPAGGFFRERDGKFERVPAMDCGNQLIEDAARALATRPGGLSGVTSELLTEFASEEKQQYLQVAPFRDVGGLDWLVVAVVPVADVLGAIRNTTRDTVALCMLAVSLAVFAGIVVSARIAKPVETLGEAAKAYSHGDWDHPIPLHRGDEIGRLADTFRHMAGQLKESFSTLEHKVEERTAELSEANTRLTREIAERERVEQALRNSTQRLRTIFDAIPGHIHVIDTDFCVLDVGDKLLTALSLKREDVIGKKCHEVFRGLPMVCDNCGVDPTAPFPELRARQSLPDEEKILGMAFKVYSAPIRDDEGKVWGFIECLMDISDLRAMEGQLLAAKEKAEEASKAKSRFLAAMSHEIRTPMNAVIGLTESVLHTSLDGEQRDQLETVKDAADHLLMVINDILDLSRIEAVGLTLEARHFMLDELIESTLRTMRVQAEQKGISLTWEQTPGLPAALLGDPGRLRQVLINLIGNAIKFTHEGGVTLRVGRAPVRPSDGEVVRLAFSVADTGEGIPPDQLSGIFEPFRLAGSGQFRHHGGTGLGLAITREIVEKMGGEIMAASEPGKGSVFRFTVRLLSGDPAQAKPVTKSGAPEGHSPLRLLLAEDNPVNVKVATTLLSRLGHSVVTAGNGSEAIARLAEGGFDAVLMDLEMPVMNGLEATRRIRAGEAGEAARDIPVLAMTAHVVQEYRDICSAVGMSRFIAKPVSLDALSQELAHLQGTGEPAATAVPVADPTPLQVLNTEKFLDNVSGDLEFAAEIFSLFLKSVPDKAEAIAESLRQKDFAKLTHLAHSLKGECGAVGVECCREAAARMEQAARKGDTAEAEAALPALNDSIQEAMAAVRDYLESA